MLRTTLFCLAVLLLGTTSHLLGQLPIFDDFDGDPTDGTPVIWKPYWGGTRDVSEDYDYIISDVDLATSYISGPSGGVSDVSVRTRLRILEGSPAAGVVARDSGDESYWGAIYTSGRIALGEFYGGQSKGQFTAIDPFTKDTLLQFDLFGNEISLTVWEEGSEKPSVPQLTLRDDTIASGGGGLFMNGLGNAGTAAFRWFQAVASDFDCNGDALLNEDDLPCVTTIEDRNDVLEALQTLPGDLDGDGEVAFADFLVLSANFNQNLPSYTDGNIDLKDGVGFEDFLILSGNFGKTANNVAAVPEPCSAIAIITLVIVASMRRHFRNGCFFAATGGE